MTTLLAFIVTLAVLIVIHEYGHYRVAVACGVKVLRFSVGFGRVVWTRQRGETEPRAVRHHFLWRICAVGEVRMEMKVGKHESVLSPES